MADQMMQQPMGGKPSTEEVMQRNRSLFNPADTTIMEQRGEISMDMPIREFFAQRGVDVDGPLSQLAQLAQEEMAKNDPQKRMQELANSQPSPDPMAGGPAPPMGGGGQPPVDPMAQLMG
jgi:hypothetical protein